jgi:MFS family permease
MDDASLVPNRLLRDHPALPVIVLCFGGLTASLTQTLLIPIQSELPQLLHTSGANAAWVITITLLAAGVAMPTAGRLADLFGKQRVLVASASMLLVASVICALSDSLAPMLAGRALQGLSMGFIPVGISLMREITPPRLTGTAIAAMSATLGVGGAIGLPLAAFVAQNWDWHALFWVAAALAAVVVASAYFLVPHVSDAAPGRFDALGAVGLAIGLVAFLVGISKATAWGWTDARTLGAIAGGILVLLVWGAYQLRTTEPLVDLRTTARLPVLMTNVAAVAIGFGMMAQVIVVPQLLQIPEITGYGVGQSILAAGLWMAPSGLMMLVFAPISANLMRRIGARLTLMIGAFVLGSGYLVGFFLMSQPWQLLVACCVASAGVGIGYAAMPTLILDSVPPREAASAVGVNALMRSVGTTLAAAVMATVLTSSTHVFGDFAFPTETAFKWCFALGALAAFVGVAIAAFVPRRTVDEEAGDEDATDDESVSRPSIAAGHAPGPARR